MKNDDRFKGITGMALTHALDDNADFVEEEDYSRPLSDQEKTSFTDSMIEEMAAIRKLDAELKKITKIKKEEIKKLSLNVAKSSMELHKGSVDLFGKVYIMIEGSNAYQYDSSGNFLGVRPVRAKEKQQTIRQQIKTGTND